ncbi:MAG: hypothetical protein IT235_01095, partial [Bacteroidia bacterium]|nr:hypothetical protein [Bacteroidia bacterium]
MTVLEGSSSISDASGNLLFYTDGYTVWNKNDVQMANGTGLKGFVASGTQTSVIVKKPGANSIYYIFTLLFDLYYSEVDMSLDGGLGDVVVATKNTYLGQNGTEKVTAVKHCNNIDVWVIMPMSASNQFSVFLVTAAGVNPTPVFSTAGVTMVGARGQMKASPDGKKVGYVTLEGDYAEILDFDNSSGILSNPILIGPSSVYDQVYGCEFSPDNTKFYMNNTDVTNSAIWQFNLCAGNEASINASGLKIATAAGNSGQLQLAPDKKIYSARFGKA